MVSTEWRENREADWYKDIGYGLQDVVTGHRYDLQSKGAKPEDPGWHPCSCGEWEGYWSGFEPHVADHLRALVNQRLAEVYEEGYSEGMTDEYQGGHRLNPNPYNPDQERHGLD